MSKVYLSQLLGPAYHGLARDVFEHGHTHYDLAGGRGSMKSSFVSLSVVYLLLLEPDAHAPNALSFRFSSRPGKGILDQDSWLCWLSPEGTVEKLAAYTKAFMAAGGTHIQYNILDSEDLKDAKVKPEEHEDLIVRIGGFSAYFVQLSGEIQDDVIFRSELSL